VTRLKSQLSAFPGEGDGCLSQTTASFSGTTSGTKTGSILQPLQTTFWQRSLSWLAQLSRPPKRGSDQTETESGSTEELAILAWTTVAEYCEPFSYQAKDISPPAFSNGSVRGGVLMNYRCRVCGYGSMPDPPERHNICPCCGTEYGVDDDEYSYEELRDDWLLRGGHWFSTLEGYLPPPNWSPWDQLDLAGYRYCVPRPENSVATAYIAPSWDGPVVAPPKRVRWTN
jgi:hypothetical protein